VTKKRGVGDRRKKTAARLRVADVLFESSSEGILISDSKNLIIKVNPAFSSITGYPAEEVMGKDPSFLSSGRQGATFYKAMWNALSRRGVWEGEVWNRRKNGEVYPEWLSITALKDANGAVESFVAIFSDISKRRRYEESAGYQVNYDAMTGLPNRRLLQDRVHRALKQAAADRRQVAVLHVDMDKFKDVNTHLGLDVGDALLAEMGARIKSCLRNRDTVGRLGGDEFLVVLPVVRSTEEVSMVIRRLQEALSKPLLIKGQESDTVLTASIGAAIFPNDGESVGDLIRNADTAVFHAKELGRDSSQFFTEDMNARALERLSVENMLRRSLIDGDFVLHYQPKVDLRRGVITGVEALVRWARPGKEGLEPPQSFIPLAEETGLIIPLGEWVIKTACAQAKEWRDAGFHMAVAVNLSARQLSHDGLLDFIALTLKETGLEPGLLEMEITETSLMEDAEGSAGILRKIHAMGVRLAADDFGTGYSSLSYLRNFPLDAIKIDGSFVADISASGGGDGGGRALAAAVIAIGQSLELKVIAEGVEDNEQLTFLRQQWCDEIQGFIFSRPVSADDILEMMRQGLKL